MRITIIFLLLFSFKAKAQQPDISPDMSMKDRLRLHLWAYGIADKPAQKKASRTRRLPEELWKPLRKI
ncbi:MAG TPA: hypothetical protein VNJ01_11585 [Bacteriovoracaceae bacterium]|nr:hypothetical protein [Bacteriovoracaceae bacterium]